MAKLLTVREDFFYKDLTAIPNPIASILQDYSGIPKDSQKSHILTVRDRAYGARPYPCLGRFRFLELDLASYPLYESYVLPALREENTVRKRIFLDLGTCLGQDLRKLIYDGVDPSQLYGSDIVSDFIDSGYELFRDETRMPRAHFICPADVFDFSDANLLNQLHNIVDILHATAVFHLFSGDEQADVARQCLRLLRKDPGTRSLALGGQAGNIEAQESVRKDGAKKYRHNGDSWKRLWEHVSAESEFKDTIKSVSVGVQMEDWSRWTANKGDNARQQKHIGSLEEGFRWMVWQVWVQF